MISDFSVGGGDNIAFGADVRVAAFKTSFLSTARTINRIDVGNRARGLDLVMSLASDAGTQTVAILDAYSVSGNS